MVEVIRDKIGRYSLGGKHNTLLYDTLFSITIMFTECSAEVIRVHKDILNQIISIQMILFISF